MTAFSVAHEVGTAFCEALGLDPQRVHRLEIVATTWELLVTVTEFLDADRAEKIVRVLKATSWSPLSLTAEPPMSDAVKETAC